MDSSFIVKPRPKRSVLPPQKKKRKFDHKIEEINFDLSAREDYLTGFHKRKVQRSKQAQVEAEKKAREERIVMRKQVCFYIYFTMVDCWVGIEMGIWDLNADFGNDFSWEKKEERN